MTISLSAFLDAFRAAPDDPTPRLVCADFLDEQGQSERAEFIRLQCRRAQFPDDHPEQVPLAAREKQLLDRHAEAWRAPFTAEHRCIFVRGFVEHIQIDMGELNRRGRMLFAAAPLRHLHLSGALENEPEQVRKLARQRFLAHVETLDLYGGAPLGTEQAAELLCAGGLGRLNRLILGEGDSTPEMIDVLAAARLPALEELFLWDFHQGELGDAGARRLAASEAFAGLKTLDLLHTGLRTAGAEALAGSPHLTQLRRLSLGRMECGYAPNRIGPSGARALAESRNLAELEDLGLAMNQLGDEGLLVLAGSLHLPRLQMLRLEANNVGDAGLAALASSRLMRGLQLLDLSHNPIGDSGVQALADSPHAARLRCLWLLHNAVGPVGVQALARSESLAGLRRLCLARNILGDPGVQALLDSPLADQLVELNLHGVALQEQQKQALRDRYGDRVRW